MLYDSRLIVHTLSYLWKANVFRLFRRSRRIRVGGSICKACRSCQRGFGSLCCHSFCYLVFIWFELLCRRISRGLSSIAIVAPRKTSAISEVLF